MYHNNGILQMKIITDNPVARAIAASAVLPPTCHMICPATIYDDDKDRIHGALVRVTTTGRYCFWTGGAIRVINQKLALEALKKRDAEHGKA